jgi:hypothetical protein
MNCAVIAVYVLPNVVVASAEVPTVVAAPLLNC